jgi:hypothetical protein
MSRQAMCCTEACATEKRRSIGAADGVVANGARHPTGARWHAQTVIRMLSRAGSLNHQVATERESTLQHVPLGRLARALPSGQPTAAPRAA